MEGEGRERGEGEGREAYPAATESPPSLVAVAGEGASIRNSEPSSGAWGEGVARVRAMVTMRACGRTTPPGRMWSRGHGRIAAASVECLSVDLSAALVATKDGMDRRGVCALLGGAHLKLRDQGVNARGPQTSVHVQKDRGRCGRRHLSQLRQQQLMRHRQLLPAIVQAVGPVVLPRDDRALDID